jgi:hypothetical protein
MLSLEPTFFTERIHVLRVIQRATACFNRFGQYFND